MHILALIASPALGLCLYRIKEAKILLITCENFVLFTLLVPNHQVLVCVVNIFGKIWKKSLQLGFF